MRIHKSKLILFVGICLSFTACWHSHDRAEDHSANPDSAAGKTGGVAYKVSKEAGKAAKEIGHKLANAAKDAHEGWKNAAEEDKAKRRQ